MNSTVQEATYRDYYIHESKKEHLYLPMIGFHSKRRSNTIQKAYKYIKNKKKFKKNLSVILVIVLLYMRII